MTVSPVSHTPSPAQAAPPSGERPSNLEVEHENQRSPDQEGQALRPATEPEGAGKSSRSPKTRTDPGSGESA